MPHHGNAKVQLERDFHVVCVKISYHRLNHGVVSDGDVIAGDVGK